MSITSSSLLPVGYKPTPVVDAIRQSPPVDLDIPYDVAWLKGKTIVITGGASGFGAAYVKAWSAAGACIIIGDINVSAGDQLARETRAETGNQQVHFVHCNVCDWISQVNFFKDAVKLSPHGGIDIVVPNAGVAGPDDFEEPRNLDAAEPPKPNLRTFEVNITGVLYTVHLALFWLPRNPGSQACTTQADPTSSRRDRCILLVGSLASLYPIPGQPLYGVSKHGVLGLFRTLRSSSFMHGVRVNLLAPYFIETPIVSTPARVMLAGGAMGKPEDVVDAATRLVADTRILGRALTVGPKIQVVPDSSGQLHLSTRAVPGEKMRAVWEAYAEDYDDTEAFGRNMVRVFSQVSAVRGWIGWASDIVKAVKYSLGYGGR